MWLTVLKNRYTLTFGLAGLLALVWNVYVVFNDDGILVGTVVDRYNRPVAGARVVLSEKSLLVTAPRDEVATDAAGRFRFEGHSLYHLYLEAGNGGGEGTARREVRLYFKGQNKVLRTPLVLEAKA